MAEFSQGLSGYGHFGLTSYNIQERAWYFRGRPQSHSPFVISNSPRQLLHGLADDTLDYAFHESRNTNMAIVADTYPSVTGLAKFLDPELITSWAVSTSTRFYNPFGGRLFGVVAILIEEVREFRSKTVIACVDGPGSTRLRILALQTEYLSPRIGVALAAKGSLSTYDLKVPINQVQFSGSAVHQRKQYGQLLVLRMDVKTAILEVKACLDADNVADTFPGPVGGLAQVRCYPVLEIHSSDRRARHADVSFNPWCHTELAIIDVSGTWGVYDVTSQDDLTSKPDESPKPMINGSISDETEILQDGWARISWITNTYTLVMCTRTRLLFYHALGKITTLFSNSHKIPPETNWYIDIRVVGDVKHHLFIITTTQLIWTTVAVHDNLVTGEFTVNPFTLSISRHYRDPNDMNMRLEVVSHKSGYIVIIFSKNSLDLTCYHFSYTITEHDVSTFATQPTQITLPSNFTQGIKDLEIQKQDDIVSHQGSTNGSAFYNLIVLLEDYSLWTVTLIIGRNSLDGTIQECIQLTSPSPIPQERFLAQSFVIPDDFDDTSQYWAIGQPQDPFIETRVRKNGREFSRPYFNMHPIYQQLSDLRFPISPHCSLEDESTSLDEFKRYIQNVEVKQPSMTVLEISTPFIVPDIDEVSDLLSGVTFFIRAQAANPLRSSAVSDLIPSLKWEEISQDLDQILEHFVGTLPSKTPLQYRRRKYSIALSIVTELHLAALKVPFSFKSSKQPSQISLPIHSSPSKSTKLSRQPLPAPSLSGTQLSSSRLETINEETPSSPTMSSDEAPQPPTSILHKFLSFSGTLPATPSATHALSHWTVGADPANYDFLWQLAKDDKAREWAQMTEEERRKRRRREEQLSQAQEKESQRFMQMTQTQNEDPFAGSSQRTRPSVGENQSLLKAALASQREMALETQSMGSQVGEATQVNQRDRTQAETQTPSKKKKKRVKGF